MTAEVAETIPVGDEAGLRRRIGELEAELAHQRQLHDDIATGYKETFDLADVGIAHVTPDGRFIDANARFCAMLGRSVEALRGTYFSDVTHPEDVGRNLELLDSFRRNEIPGYRMEKRYLRADGSFFWADLTVSAQRRADGTPLRLIAVVVDISEHKAVEERQAYLMGELNHRTKNLLALLQAVVRQTSASASSVEGFKTAVIDRLNSMAASQTALVSGDGRQAMLGELVAGQVAVVAPPDDPRFAITGPDVRVGAEAARAIGMALHELATNASKYGALSTPAGRVAIDWEVLAASDELVLRWVERNGPIVQAPTHTGFGRRVIERMAIAATDGRVDLRFDPDGVKWRLVAPLSRIAPRPEF